MLFKQLKQNYQNIKLLVETCEIWMTEDYETKGFAYGPIVHFMSDRITASINLLIEGAEYQLEELLLLAKSDKSGKDLGIAPDRQILMINLGYVDELFTFLRIN